MKKIFFVGLMTFAAVNLMAEVKVATFENEAGGINVPAAESHWYGIDVPADGKYTWKSGDFSFQSHIAYGGTYFDAFVVTNETSTAFVDYNDAYRSASGGAFKGQNYVVWYPIYGGQDTVSFAAQTVPGFYVNNNVYAVNSMSNGDGYCPKYTSEDYFQLVCTGLKAKAVVGTVTFDLAKGGKYVNQWTYVDLSSLGEIDAMIFSTASSQAGTPTYFAMDNFGAAKPDPYVAPEMAEFPKATALENTEVEIQTTKVLRNGQLFILHNGMMYNVQGARVE